MVDEQRFDTLRVEANGARGQLVLTRPDQRNALSRQSLEELVTAATWFDRRPQIKVVVVSGEGASFCAGFDLQEFGSPTDATADGELARDGADAGRRMAEAVSGMRALTVARIHGYCVGGGLVLAAACDLRVAADDAVFFIPEVDLGIPLAWGGLARLVREIGPALTKELVLTCRRFGAEEARSAGLLNRVVPAQGLDDEVEALATDLAQKPSLALQLTKRYVNALVDQMASTAMSFVDADLLGAALRDPESRAAGRTYLQGRTG